MDDRYRMLCERLDALSDQQAAAVCAASADKIRPIIERVGLPETWRQVQECVETCWKVLLGEAGRDSVTGLTQALERLPEWACEDNSFLPFLVTESLDFVRLAVASIESPTSAKENAKGALDLIRGIMSAYDAGTREVTALGVISISLESLQSAEEESQFMLLDMLRAETVLRSAVALSLRQEAVRIASLIGQALPVVCYAYVRR